MPLSKAHIKATAKYNKANYDEIKITVPKGSKAALQNLLFAERDNISMTKYINNLIENDIKCKLSEL